jgi:IS30 family transposase
MYSYIDCGVLDLNNLDLRLKIRRPQRKKSGPKLKVDKHCHEGRTYKDYLAYMQEHPNSVVCQMDTVEGKKGGKVMLTLYFQNCGLQLLYMRDRNNASSVTEVFHMLRDKLGDDFTKLFQVILTDRGSEFTNPQAIEYNTKTGERECRVFYCDPGASNQKSECEKNHELIRYIFPKGASLDGFAQDAATLAMNHINSYPRAKWGVASPIELFEALYGPRIAAKLGLVKIELPFLILNPDLVKLLKK